jgi:hypothetical protein
MAEPQLLLYNRRQQPVELHADGRVEVLAPGETLCHRLTPQIERLLDSGALQSLDVPPPAENAADTPPSTEPTAAPAGEAPRDDAVARRGLRGRSRPKR